MNACGELYNCKNKFLFDKMVVFLLYYVYFSEVLVTQCFSLLCCVFFGFVGLRSGFASNVLCVPGMSIPF